LYQLGRVTQRLAHRAATCGEPHFGIEDFGLAAPAHTPIPEKTTRLIDQVARAFADAADHEAAVRATVTSAIPQLADLIIVVLLRDGAVDRIEVGGEGPDLERRAADLVQGALPALTRVTLRDWQQGRYFRWISRVDNASARFLSTEPELLRLLTLLRIHSLMVVPLRTGGRILGGMAFARTGSSEPYHAAELALAQIVARRVAIGIDTAELRQRSTDDERQRVRLAESLQKWTRVFDLAGWGAAIVDTEDLRIDAANPALAHMHGYAEPDHLIGQQYSILLPKDRIREPEEWKGQSNRPVAYESVNVRQDGGSFPVLTNVTPLETAAGAKSYVVTVQNVTELKLAEERLRRAQRLEAVGRLAGGVAHEVNNMMTIILGFSDLLSSAADLPRGRQRDVEEIRKAAIRTARVTQQLLAFSRQQILQPVHLQLNEVMTEMSSVLQHLLPANVRVETMLSPTPTAIQADRAQIDQVLINLAFNARDAMPQGGTLRLATDSRHFEPEDGHRLIGIPVSPGQYAVLTVSDTGQGMSPDTLSQVFVPFFTTKPAGTGTGLGLATVYGIVKQSGGFIWASSDLGTGTTFTVCLPQVEPRSAAPTGQPVEESHHHPRPSATVLIVEDEDGVRELARRVLEDEGYLMLDMKTGAEAIAALDSGAPDIDLVLADVVTPDMSALQLEASLRARCPELPLLYMSGYSWDEVVSRGLVSGVRRFIQKPFTAAELVHAVAQELAERRPRSRTVTA
jgi:two-component system, cell cycle sensor histidine kinase and response regulator CckA